MRGGVSFPAHSGQTGSAAELGPGDWVPASAGTTEGLTSCSGNDGGKLVLAPAPVADDALDERVGEALDVAAGPPDLWVHDDGRVEADHVVALEDHGAPPGVLDVALELGAERAVVPGAGQASVNLAALEDEASALAEGYELVQVDGHALLRGGLCGEIIASAPTAPVGRKAEGTETPSPRPPPVKGEGIHSRRPGYPPARERRVEGRTTARVGRV